MSSASGASSENRWGYLWVAEQLRQEILNGTYRAGKRLPGEPVLSRRFGVGRATVARALEILEQSNLVFRRRSSGTYVQVDAARGHIRLAIGYLIRNISVLNRSVAGRRLEAVRRYMENRGHTVHVLTRDDIEEEGSALASIRRLTKSGTINGLIVGMPLHFDLLRSVGQIVQTACIDGDQVPDNVLSVGVDYAQGFFAATRYLLQLGHRGIGLLGGNPYSSIGYRSRLAFRLAVQLAGGDPACCPVSLCSYEPGRCRRETQRLLREYPGLTGMICGDDGVATAVMETAQAAGLSVPEQFSIIGCNDSVSDSVARPLLTTLRADFAGVGELAAEMLLARIYGGDVPPITYVQPELVVRASTASPPGSKTAGMG